MFIHILTNYTKNKSCLFKVMNYIKVLGFNKKGENYLKDISGNLILNISKCSNDLISIDLKASKLYDLLTDNNTYIEEYQFPLKGE